MSGDLLLDTHTFLWWATDDRRLSSNARSAIAGARVFLSVVTPWELVVKQAVGRLELLDPPPAQPLALVRRAPQVAPRRRRRALQQLQLARTKVAPRLVGAGRASWGLGSGCWIGAGV